MKVTEETIDKVTQKIEAFKTVIKMLEEIKDGKPITQVCNEYEISQQAMRGFLHTRAMIKGLHNPAINFDELLGWEDEFLRDLCNNTRYDKIETYVLSDFYESYAKAVQCLTEREKEVLELRYAKYYTLKEISNFFGITQERIRQIEARAMRKLRHPKNMRYFLYGVNADDVVRKEKQIQQLERERQLYIDNINNKSVILAKEVEQLKLESKKLEYNIDEIEKAKDNTDIDTLELTVRSEHFLRQAGVNTIGDLSRMDFEQLTNVRNLGRKSINEIITKLKQQYGIRINGAYNG